MSVARDREAERLARWHARATDTHEQAWIVTYGLTRRLIRARNQREARDRFNVLIARPGHLAIADHELTVRAATGWDLAEFDTTRPARTPMPTLFGEDAVVPDPEANA